VCYLGGTSGIEVLDERSGKKCGEGYETIEGKPPPERLAAFDGNQKRRLPERLETIPTGLSKAV